MADWLDRFPLDTIKKKWSKVAGAVGGIVSALVSAGLISAGQGEAVTELFTKLDSLWALIPGVITAGSAVWSAFQTGSEGEKKVTPVAAPYDNQGRRLIPEGEDEQPRDNQGRFVEQ